MTRINTNVSSLIAQTNLARSQQSLQTSLTRLSTGLRINSGKDDPAGLIAAEVLKSDITATNTAISNSQTAEQLIATADSALGQVSSLLNDIRGLVSQAANTGALSADQISANQLQVDSSLAAIDRVSQTTEFQGRRLLDGSLDFLSTASPNVKDNASGTLNSDTIKANATVAGSTGSVKFTAQTGGTAGNGAHVNIVEASAGPTTSSYNGTTKILTVSVASGATAASVVAAVAADASSNAAFDATATVAGALFAANTADATTLSGTTASGAAADVLTLSATTGGTAYNNLNVTFTDDVTAGSETAAYTTATNTLSVHKASTSTGNQVKAAINTNGAFSAAVSGAGTKTFAAGTTSAVTSGGADHGTSSQDLQVNQANFGTASSITAQIDVDTQASQAGLTYAGGPLTSALVLEIGGKSGFQNFNFGSGTSIAQINTAINQSSDATGVSSTVSGGNLVLKSTEYGTNAFVSAKALSGTFATTDNNNSAASATRSAGIDAVVRINGVQATADGLNVKLNTATLDLNFRLNSHLATGASFNFSITGGGANFQLGTSVVSNQQARLGIQGVNTGTLGGLDGNLYQLRSGGDKALATDAKGAAKIVEEVISRVASLRGRLGAFQKTTLETNINTLTDTLQNLTDAQSTIRDANFAAESANLTRAQVLVQAGTSVLQIANQSPQSVLKLLQ